MSEDFRLTWNAEAGAIGPARIDFPTEESAIAFCNGEEAALSNGQKVKMIEGSQAVRRGRSVDLHGPQQTTWKT
jgi:hypothetical protein